MKLFLLFTVLMSANLHARTSGEIRFGDGSTSVRISVGNNSSNAQELVKRIRRLERAVSHLQVRVYELEDGNYEEQNYTCSVITCRKSSGLQARNARNCEFFDLFKKERISVWATSGAEAESGARGKLKSDSDVIIIKEATLSCR